MAEKGWREVTAAWADPVGPAERHALDVFYLDRVVRADLAAMYLKAVIRGDPRCRDLLDALVGMVGALPPDVVVDARSVGDRLVRPTVALWWRLPRDARPAFTSLVAAARNGSGPPEVVRRARGSCGTPACGCSGPAAWWVSSGSRWPGRRPRPRSPSSASIAGSGGSRSPDRRRASTAASTPPTSPPRRRLRARTGRGLRRGIRRVAGDLALGHRPPFATRHGLLVDRRQAALVVRDHEDVLERVQSAAGWRNAVWTTEFGVAPDVDDLADEQALGVGRAHRRRRARCRR